MSLWWWSFRTSRSSVSVLFKVLPGLSRMIVFGVAPLRTGRRKSPRKVCFWVTRRGPIAPDAFDRRGAFFQPVFSGERDVRQSCVVMARSFTEGAHTLLPSTTFSRGHRFGMAPNLWLAR